jgi:2-hydroxy-6-oxonona-2,4-dienedioate hydrolase
MFRSTWTEVNGLPVPAMASTGPEVCGRVPVVLVHGLGLSHRYMMPTAECLASSFPIYVPDLPSFGESGHPEKVLDVSGLADALAAWIETAALERVALLGNSFACQIIVDLAARIPGG